MTSPPLVVLPSTRRNVAAGPAVLVGVPWRLDDAVQRHVLGDDQLPHRFHALRAPRRMRMGPGLAELGVAWCGKPVSQIDAWGLPGTANCCCEHVLQPR